MFNLEIPINPLSFGQMGWGVAYEIYKRGLSPNIFPIGEINLNSFTQDANFAFWLQKCCKKAASEYSDKDPSFVLWHINGSHKRLTNKTALWTAYEASAPTKTEVNICNKYDKVFFTSEYARDSFSVAGLEQASYLPNYFDEIHIKNLNIDYNEESKPVTFGLVGKLEKRKNTREILVSWANKFGNNNKYRLICCVWNPFLPPDVQTNEINRIFNNQKPFNIEFYPFQEKNSDFNKILDRIDIDLSGMSGAEGWGLPCFNSLCLGKICVVLHAHAHKSYVDETNSVLLSPNGKIDIADGVFFNNQEFNCGSMYTFSQEEAQKSYEKALDKLETCGRLDEQKDLKEKFSVKNTVNTILEWVG